MTIGFLSRLTVAAVCGVIAGVSFAAGPAAAADWPTKPVRIVVPIAPGSVTDTLIRQTADTLGQKLGQPFVIDNRPGAATVIGIAECANSEPDGSTICLATHSGLSLNPQLMSGLPYDASKLELIMPLYFIGEGLMVPTALGVNSVEELKAMAEADPSKLNFATLGGGSLQDLFLRWLNKEWGTDVVGIAYGGGGPILQAVAQNESQMAVIGLGNYLPIADAGTVKLLAVEMQERSPLFPDVPTFAEVGLEGWQAPAFWSLIAPPGTPADILDAVHDAFAALYDDPEYIKTLKASGMEPRVMSRGDFAEFVKGYHQTGASLISLAGIAPKPFEAK